MYFKTSLLYCVLNWSASQLRVWEVPSSDVLLQYSWDSKNMKVVFNDFLNFWPNVVKSLQMTLLWHSLPFLFVLIASDWWLTSQTTNQIKCWSYDWPISKRSAKSAVSWHLTYNVRLLREHPHMTSDDFGSFLTYLPTQIRYHQILIDLPSYPKIWRQISKPIRIHACVLALKILSLEHFSLHFWT